MLCKGRKRKEKEFVRPCSHVPSMRGSVNAHMGALANKYRVK